MLHHAQIALTNLFGYHLAPESLPKADDIGFAMDETTASRFVIRLARKSAGANASLLHAHAVDLALADKRTAARRGLLMAVLGILICSEGQAVDEDILFTTLSLDPRLLRARIGGDKAEEVRGFAAAVDDFADQEEGVELLARWPTIVSKDFVAARLLVREKRKDGVDATTGAMKETFVYGIGPAGRAVVSPFAPLEIARIFGGASAALAGSHSRSRTCQLMPKEVGTETGAAVGMVAFFSHLDDDQFSKDVRRMCD